MVKPLPLAVYGPNVAFREYSLFDKPEMPEAVKTNVLEVNPCEKVRSWQGYFRCSDSLEDGSISQRISILIDKCIIDPVLPSVLPA